LHTISELPDSFRVVHCADVAILVTCSRVSSYKGTTNSAGKVVGVNVDTILDIGFSTEEVRGRRHYWYCKLFRMK